MARRALGPATLRIVQAVDVLRPSPWLVACSGGADSLALAWSAGFVARRRGTPVRALVIDHGLQQGSDAVAARVVRTLASMPVPDADPLCIPASAVRVAVGSSGGPESAARDARYFALSDAVAAGPAGECVLLGHTLDDQAETVLLGLARGSGARSLAGMASERGVWRRPLLGVPRETTREACRELGLEPWDDPMNADPAYARVRVRETVMPTLERELGPGVREALARTASQLRRDADALDAEASALVEEGSCAARDTLDARWLAGLDAALRERIIRSWLVERGAVEPSAEHVAAVASLVTAWHGQKAVHVPGVGVSRADGVLKATPHGSAD